MKRNYCKRADHAEVLPAQNMKEAVALVEVVEERGLVYAYGENYCYMPAPYEMKKLYESGEIGEFEYGEGEYSHNCEPIWPPAPPASPQSNPPTNPNLNHLNFHQHVHLSYITP